MSTVACLHLHLVGCHQGQHSASYFQQMENIQIETSQIYAQMRVLAGVVLDGNIPDEAILDVMNLVNDVC